MWHMHDGAGWWMVYGGISMVVFWALVIWLVVWIIRAIARYDHHQSTGRRDPLDIAKERYAKGEINKEEFDRIKKDLS